MSERALIARETAISVAINVVLSLAFFAAIFGLSAPIQLRALATDFFPQSFMVAFMGTLVPALILRRRLGALVRPIVVRSLLFAIGAAVVGGGAAFALCTANGGTEIGNGAALAVKCVYGGVLALIVTLLALAALFKSTRKAA